MHTLDVQQSNGKRTNGRTGREMLAGLRALNLAGRAELSQQTPKTMQIFRAKVMRSMEDKLKEIAAPLQVPARLRRFWRFI